MERRIARVRLLLKTLWTPMAAAFALYGLLFLCLSTIGVLSHLDHSMSTLRMVDIERGARPRTAVVTITGPLWIVSPGYRMTLNGAATTDYFVLDGDDSGDAVPRSTPSWIKMLWLGLLLIAGATAWTLIIRGVDPKRADLTRG